MCWAWVSPRGWQVVPTLGVARAVGAGGRTPPTPHAAEDAQPCACNEQNLPPEGYGGFVFDYCPRGLWFTPRAEAQGSIVFTQPYNGLGRPLRPLVGTSLWCCDCAAKRGVYIKYCCWLNVYANSVWQAWVFKCHLHKWVLHNSLRHFGSSSGLVFLPY